MLLSPVQALWCLSPCMHPSITALCQKPGVLPSLQNSAPRVSAGGLDLCTSLSAHTSWAKSSTLTACHSPNTPGMSPHLPK